MESQENMNGKDMEYVATVERLNTNKLIVGEFPIIVGYGRLIITTPDKTAGIEIDRQGNIRTIGKVSYEESKKDEW